MNYLFSGCSSLKSIPDISKWNTSTVINMKGMFEECSSLKSIPDITKWNTSNVKNMKYMFKNCSSLKSLPDISKWDIDNCLKYKKIYEMFNGCSKPLNIPDKFENSEKCSDSGSSLEIEFYDMGGSNFKSDKEDD